jgi:Protein of unknown function (DUF5661)
MKDERFFRHLMAGFGLLIVLGILLGPAMANAQATDKAKFETYRTAIKKDYGIDIKEFKDQLKGGKADGKDITKYDLKQILMGIKVEQEHTTNKMIALEITLDHLEEIPDYYTRLQEMEEEAEEEMEEVNVKTKK